MSTYDVTGVVDLDQLGAEVATVHGWAEPPGLVLDGTRLRVLRDGADPTRVRGVLAAHKPAPRPDPDAAFRVAVEGATTLAALKAAILGSTGPGAQPRVR